MYLHFLWQKEKGVDQGERSTLPETTEIYKTRPERYVAGSFFMSRRGQTIKATW